MRTVIRKRNRRTLEIHPVWNDVPRGTMDEVSSHVRLNLPSVYNGKAAE